MKRMNMSEVAPKAYRAMYAVEKYVQESGLEKSLYELVKMRASQLNGCAYCLNMHSRDAMKEGETAQRLFLLDAWRETELYSDRERAALAFTEALTLVADNHVPDDVYRAAAEEFSEEELSALIMGIVAINGWNRMSIATEAPLD